MSNPEGKNNRNYSRYFRRVMVYERYPPKNGYYKVSYKKSKIISDLLFIDDTITKKVWFNQVDWWEENIEEPYAVTKEEAVQKLRADDEFCKMILELYFVGKQEEYRKPTPQEISLLKLYLQNT